MTHLSVATYENGDYCGFPHRGPLRVSNTNVPLRLPKNYLLIMKMLFCTRLYFKQGTWYVCMFVYHIFESISLSW